MPDVRCGNCNTLLQPRHYEMGKCFNCDNSIKNHEKVLLRNEGNFLKKMLLTIFWVPEIWNLVRKISTRNRFFHLQPFRIFSKQTEKKIYMSSSKNILFWMDCLMSQIRVFYEKVLKKFSKFKFPKSWFSPQHSFLKNMYQQQLAK